MVGLRLDPSTLLVAARAVGLAVAADGDRLSVRGPKGAAGLVHLVLKHESSIVDLLATEVAAGVPSGVDEEEPGLETAAPDPPAVAGPPIPPEWHGAPLDGHWRPAIAWWPVEWRQRWGVRANELEAGGWASDVAEYLSWREALRDLNAAEARGERIEYREPFEVLSDQIAMRQIDSLTWGKSRVKARPLKTDRGARDVRRGDSWLPWHFPGPAMVDVDHPLSKQGRPRARCAQHKLRPAVKWHGGKHYLARRIIERLPDHQIYVEPFAGGLSVLLNMVPCSIEIASDLNAGLIGCYRVLRDRTEELMARLDSLEYNASTFAWSLGSAAGADPLEAAVRFLVRNRFSRGGLGRDFAWSERLRGGRPGDLNAWETIKAELPRIARRLAHVDLRCQDAIRGITETDSPETLTYLDPTYPHSTRTARDTYAHEMSDDQHRRLIETITHCRGMVAISGYANPLYDRALSGWKRIEFDMPNHAGQGRSKQRRTEVLWMNPRCGG
jgi:DNA adenine methylase